MSPQVAARMIRIVAIISIISALLFAFAGVNDFSGAVEIFFGLASSGTNGVAGLNTPEAALGMAIAGGVYAGFMVMYLMITAPGIEQGNEMIRKGSIYAFVVWFLVDSAGSAATGNASNVIINIILVTTYLAPLVLVKRTA